MVLTFLPMVMFISASISMGNRKATDSTNGLMGTRIQESLKMGISTERVNGKRNQNYKVISVISMKETMLLIERMDKAYSSGRAEIFIREIMSRMSVMASARCFGSTEASIRADG
jgi:hypothetical protein